MRLSKFTSSVVLGVALTLVAANVSVAASSRQSTSDRQVVGINVALSKKLTSAEEARLRAFGPILNRMPEINALTMRATLGSLPAIQALPFVKAANQDAERVGRPVPESPFEDAASGTNPWHLAQIGVADKGSTTRSVSETGAGTYVAVLDTGLHSSWSYYFGTERIASQYGISFGGGGGEVGTVSTQPNKWGLDQNGHGTHVTSTILGYNLRGAAIGGVAPLAKVIPVKVLNQNGSGWSSVIAQGLLYVANLKEGVLAGSPVIVNMSLGGSRLDAIEELALNYAIAAGVIIVASAGNSGTRGMGYPGAYPPVISVASTGWDQQMIGAKDWWYSEGGDPTSGVFISGFSSRELEGQQLDVAAPGQSIVGPYQTNGQISYYYLSGTSMASPHVAGLAALMAQKDGGLTQSEVEAILKSTATPIAPGTATYRISRTSAAEAETSWGSDATGSGLVNAPAALAAITP